MTDTTPASGQAASTLQLQSFDAYLDLFRQDVLPVQTDRYQYHPFYVHPRSLWSWYVFQPQAKVRYVTPIASQRLYRRSSGATTNAGQPAMLACDLPCLWICDDGQLVVSWLNDDISQLELRLKYASNADLRSMDAHGLQRIICQLGIAVSLHLDDTDEAAEFQQQLQQMDDQSHQAALTQ